MATSGSFNTTGYQGRCLTFSWERTSYSVSNNTSTISWKLVGANLPNTSPSGYYMSGGFKVVIDGTTVYSVSTNTRIELSNGTVVTSGTQTISHNNDGTKTFSVSAQAGIYTYAVNCSGSGSWALDQIPRATTPTLSSSSVNVDSSITITLSRASSSFTHKLYYSFGSLSSQTSGLSKSSSVGTSATFTPPASLLSNTTSGTCTITCVTYKNSTQTDANKIGTKTVTCTINVPNSGVYLPSITALNAAIYNNSGFTAGGNTYYVQGKSQCTLSISGASAGSGASISSYSITGPGLTLISSSGETSTLSQSGTLTYTAKITDSRKRTATKTCQINVLPYSQPTIKISATRTTTEGSVIVTYNADYSSLDNQNSLKSITIEKKSSTDSSWSNATTIPSPSSKTGSITLTGYDTTKSYNFRAQVVDKAYSTSSEYSDIVTIATGAKLINIKDDATIAKSIAFGKWAETANTFECDLAADFNKPVNIDSTLNVGSSLNVDDNIIFNHEEQTAERQIRFRNNATGTDQYAHKACLYGGNPNSTTAIGMWDTKNSQAIMYYNDQAEVTTFGHDTDGPINQFMAYNLYTTGDNDGTNSKKVVNSLLDKMKTYGMVPVRFSFYPYLSGNTYYGFLANHGSGYAVLWGVSYNGYQAIWTKSNGTWGTPKNVAI